MILVVGVSMKSAFGTQNSLSEFFKFAVTPPTPLPQCSWGEVECYIGITLSVCLCVLCCVQVVTEFRISNRDSRKIIHFGAILPVIPHLHEPVSCGKTLVAVFTVEVTVMVRVLKKWLFLAYLPSFWTCYSQTWYGCALSQARVLCKMFQMLASCSKLQWGFESCVSAHAIRLALELCATKHSMLVSDHQCVVQKDWVAISEVRVAGFKSLKMTICPSFSPCRLHSLPTPNLVCWSPYRMNDLWRNWAIIIKVTLFKTSKNVSCRTFLPNCTEKQLLTGSVTGHTMGEGAGVFCYARWQTLFVHWSQSLKCVLSSKQSM